MCALTSFTVLPICTLHDWRKALRKRDTDQTSFCFLMLAIRGIVQLPSKGEPRCSSP
jgi:hypothetical protein